MTRLLEACDTIPGRGKILLYRNVHGPVQPSVQWVPASYFAVVKRSGRETDKGLTYEYSVEFKNVRRYVSIPQKSSWPAG